MPLPGTARLGARERSVRLRLRLLVLGPRAIRLAVRQQPVQQPAAQRRSLLADPPRSRSRRPRDAPSCGIYMPGLQSRAAVPRVRSDLDLRQLDPLHVGPAVEHARRVLFGSLRLDWDGDVFFGRHINRCIL
jgi:hypothetical protein